METKRVSSDQVQMCLTALRVARADGDKLKIALAQAAFDDALDRFLAQNDVTDVTRNSHAKEGVHE